MANSPSTANAKKEASYEDLNEQISILRDDISALTGTIADLTKAQANQLTGAAAQQAEAARQKGVETAALVANQAKDVQTQAQEFVDARPGTALGIAAGLGFLVGMMSARK